MRHFKSRLHEIRERVETAFTAETSFDATAYQGGSHGHCAVVAAIVWAELGGQLLSTYEEGPSHWYNRVGSWPGSAEVDLTGDQFGHDSVRIRNGTHLYKTYRIRSVEEINAETFRRAGLLAERAKLPVAKRRLDAFQHRSP